MYKKIFTLLLAIILGLSLTACGDTKNNIEDNQQSSTDQSAENFADTDETSDDLENNAENSSETSDDSITTMNNYMPCTACGILFESVLGRVYCDNCRCWTTTCNNQRTSSSSYCIEHKCLMCDGLVSQYSSYCSDHCCHDYGCDYPSIPGERYCAEHLE